MVDLKLFDKAEESMKNVKNLDLPKEWKSIEHDRILFELVSEKGFSYLDSIYEDNTFLNFDLDKDDYMNRIIFLCDFFKTITQTQKTKKKNQIREIQNELLNSKLKTEVSQDNFLNQDSLDGSGKKKFRKSLDLDLLNIIYPLQISPTLRLINLGKIEYKRPAFHNENNIFPIGYKAVREHYSYLNPHIKALYTCEILDGGEKPLFKVTFENEEDNSIIKDTCTACWIIICNKINDIIQNRKGKVTISGTERFGLADATVVKLIQNQPEFKLLSKYKAK